MTLVSRLALSTLGLLLGCTAANGANASGPRPAEGAADSATVAAAAIHAFLASHPSVSAARVTTFRRKRGGVVVEVARSLSLPQVTDEGVIYCVDPQLGVTEIGGALMVRTAPDPVCHEQ